MHGCVFVCCTETGLLHIKAMITEYWWFHCNRVKERVSVAQIDFGSSGIGLFIWLLSLVHSQPKITLPLFWLLFTSGISSFVPGGQDLTNSQFLEGRLWKILCIWNLKYNICVILRGTKRDNSVGYYILILSTHFVRFSVMRPIELSVR